MKNLPTGAAQSVTDTVERVRALFKDRAEWTPKPQAERKNFRRAYKPEQEPNSEPAEASTPEPETDEASTEETER